MILHACVSIGEAKNVSNRAGDRGAEEVPVPVLFLPEAGERAPAHRFWMPAWPVLPAKSVPAVRHLNVFDHP